MKRSTPTADGAASVPYPSSRSGVVASPRRLFRKTPKLPAGAPSNLADEALPELTDAWFEETIRQVDEASMRLRRAR